MNARLKEIFWNLVNAGLAGSLVMLGAFSDGTITKEALTFALVAGAAVAINQFKDYWKKEEEEYCPKRMGSFISFI